MTAAITDADRLAERVALRMCEVAGFDPAVDLVSEQARAAIAVVLEEAARVAEKWLEPIMATKHENDTYRSIAAAIRALGEGVEPLTPAPE